MNSDEIKGRAKKAVGELTGDEKLKQEGSDRQGCRQDQGRGG